MTNTLIQEINNSIREILEILIIGSVYIYSIQKSSEKKVTGKQSNRKRDKTCE